MQKLTECQRISFLMIWGGWGDRQRSYKKVCVLFNEFFDVGKLTFLNLQWSVL